MLFSRCRPPDPTWASAAMCVSVWVCMSPRDLCVQLSPGVPPR